MPLLAETVIIVSRYRAFMPFGRKIEVKKSKYEIDMCSGSIMDKLISFSLPLMLSGILQLMFNAVDIIVVGRFSGSEALAAVGLHARPSSACSPTCSSAYRWEPAC